MLEKEKDLIKAAFYLSKINKEYKCVPDCFLFKAEQDFGFTHEEAKKIRDLVQEIA